MHTTASSLVAIAQYFWWIRTSLFFVCNNYPSAPAYKITKLLYGNQQKINIEAVNDYPPIRFKIRFEL